MNRSVARTTIRVLFCLLAICVWGTSSAREARAAQSSGAGPATPQEPAAQEAEDSSFDWTTGWSYGGRGILSILVEDSLDLGLGVTGFAVRPLIGDLEFEGEIGYLTMSTVADGLPQEGRLSMFPLRATLRVQLWRFGDAKPYAGGGVGMYLSRFKLDKSVVEELAELGLAAAVTIDPGFGYHGGGGVEWQRGPASFGVDVKYVIGSANAVSTIVDQINGEVFRESLSLDLDGFWLAAGVRVEF